MKSVSNFFVYIVSLISLILFVFLVFICNPSHALDDFDLYRYGPDEKIKMERKSFIVKFVLYDTEEEINDVFYNNKKRPEGQGVRAFTLSTKDEDVCFVHIKPAKRWDDRESMTILGHEIYHCALATHKVATYDDLEEIINAEEDGAVHGNFQSKRAERYKNQLLRYLQPANKKELTLQEALEEEYKIEMEVLKQECLNHDPTIFDNPPAGCELLGPEYQPKKK